MFKRKTQKLQQQTTLVTYILVGMVLVLAILSSLTLIKFNQVNDQLASLRDQIEKETTYRESDKSSLRPAVDAAANRVVFPELGIALPYNNVTKFLTYSYDADDLRVTSTLINDNRQDDQLSCSELVRVSTVNATAYSPWEESVGTVSLGNGKTLYIVAAKAFANNEASTANCPGEVWRAVTPAQVADEFKKAQSL